MTATSRLTDDDRRVIAKARALAEPIGPAAVSAAVGFGKTADATLIYSSAFGVAQTLLREVAGIAERLGRDDDEPEQWWPKAEWQRNG